MLKHQPDPIFGFELRSLLKNGKISLKPRANAVMEDQIVFEDNSKIKVANVIWSTGFRSHYDWIKTPNILIIRGNQYIKEVLHQ